MLREHALIESAVSSNRIEGIEIDRSRIGTVLFGKPPLRDRNEEEVAGYREALAWNHGSSDAIPVSTETILELHAFSRGRVGETASPRGVKTELIRAAVAAKTVAFALADVERDCPGVSRDMIRRVLRVMRESGLVECTGRGPGARWNKRG